MNSQNKKKNKQKQESKHDRDRYLTILLIQQMHMRKCHLCFSNAHQHVPYQGV